MGDRAGIWIRVSSGGQDEASQLPDVERHCRANGYDVAKRYVLHDKSASKGEHEPMLAEMLADVAGPARSPCWWRGSRAVWTARAPSAGMPSSPLSSSPAAGSKCSRDSKFGGNGLGDEIMTTVRMVNSQAESRTK